jgi:hypothetical protein
VQTAAVSSPAVSAPLNAPTKSSRNVKASTSQAAPNAPSSVTPAVTATDEANKAANANESSRRRQLGKGQKQASSAISEAANNATASTTAQGSTEGEGSRRSKAKDVKTKKEADVVGVTTAVSNLTVSGGVARGVPSAVAASASTDVNLSPSKKVDGRKTRAAKADISAGKDDATKKDGTATVTVKKAPESAAPPLALLTASAASGEDALPKRPRSVRKANVKDGNNGGAVEATAQGAIAGKTASPAAGAADSSEAPKESKRTAKATSNKEKSASEPAASAAGATLREARKSKTPEPKSADDVVADSR